MFKKPGEGVGRPERMRKVLVTKVSIKRAYKIWNWCQVIQKYRHVVLVWRYRAGKAEVHLKFNLARHLKVKKIQIYQK